MDKETRARRCSSAKDHKYHMHMYIRFHDDKVIVLLHSMLCTTVSEHTVEVILG